MRPRHGPAAECLNPRKVSSRVRKKCDASRLRRPASVILFVVGRRGVAAAAASNINWRNVIILNDDDDDPSTDVAPVRGPPPPPRVDNVITITTTYATSPASPLTAAAAKSPRPRDRPCSGDGSAPCRPLTQLPPRQSSL